MTEVERYLFDLQGYLIVEDVLDAEAVAELNRLIDAQEMGADVEQAAGRLHTGGFLTWGQPFVDLLDHERIMPLLKVILRRRFPTRPLLCDLFGGRCRAARVARRQYALRPAGVLPFPQRTDVQWADGGLLELGRYWAETGRFLLHSGKPQGQLSLSTGNPRGPCRVRLRSSAGGKGRVGGDFYRGTHARHCAVAGCTPAALAAVQIQSWAAVVVQRPHQAAGRRCLDRAAGVAF